MEKSVAEVVKEKLELAVEVPVARAREALALAVRGAAREVEGLGLALLSGEGVGRLVT